MGPATCSRFEEVGAGRELYTRATSSGIEFVPVCRSIPASGTRGYHRSGLLAPHSRSRGESLRVCQEHILKYRAPSGSIKFRTVLRDPQPSPGRIRKRPGMRAQAPCRFAIITEIPLSRRADAFRVRSGRFFVIPERVAFFLWTIDRPDCHCASRARSDNYDTRRSSSTLLPRDPTTNGPMAGGSACNAGGLSP